MSGALEIHAGTTALACSNCATVVYASVAMELGMVNGWLCESCGTVNSVAMALSGEGESK